MSSIVSRRPPFSGSTSQANDFFWMSIRLGTSRTLSRRAKVRRVRGASTEAKTATPQGRLGGRAERARARAADGTQSATSQDSTGATRTPVRGARRSRTPSGPAPVCGGRGAVDGCDYRPRCGECSALARCASVRANAERPPASCRRAPEPLSRLPSVVPAQLAIPDLVLLSSSPFPRSASCDRKQPRRRSNDFQVEQASNSRFFGLRAGKTAITTSGGLSGS